MGLLFGLMIAFIGHRLIFGIDLTYLIIYPALFFSVVAVLISWLYFRFLLHRRMIINIAFLAINKLPMKPQRQNIR
jgi:uncharacterized protein YacL